MPKEEWGVKRLCPTTGKRFYDMNRDPIVSPYTGETVTIDTGNKSRLLVKEEKAKDKVEKDDDLLDDDDSGSVVFRLNRRNVKQGVQVFFRLHPKNQRHRHRVTVWGLSSVGRALAWHARGQGFDSPRLHQTYKSSLKWNSNR